MREDPGARRNRSNAWAPWIVVMLLVSVLVLGAVALLRPARQFAGEPPAEAALTTRDQVKKDQANFAAGEAARRRP